MKFKIKINEQIFDFSDYSEKYLIYGYSSSHPNPDKQRTVKNVFKIDPLDFEKIIQEFSFPGLVEIFTINEGYSYNDLYKESMASQSTMDPETGEIQVVEVPTKKLKTITELSDEGIIQPVMIELITEPN